MREPKLAIIWSLQYKKEKNAGMDFVRNLVILYGLKWFKVFRFSFSMTSFRTWFISKLRLIFGPQIVLMGCFCVFLNIFKLRTFSNCLTAKYCLWNCLKIDWMPPNHLQSYNVFKINFFWKWNGLGYSSKILKIFVVTFATSLKSKKYFDKMI